MTDALESGVCNIAAALPRMAQLQPQTLAVVFPTGHDQHGRRTYSQLTYQQLDEQSDAIARGLRASGLTRGMRTVLMVKPLIAESVTAAPATSAAKLVLPRELVCALVTALTVIS